MLNWKYKSIGTYKLIITHFKLMIRLTLIGIRKPSNWNN